jgi:hypothetical protein
MRTTHHGVLVLAVLLAVLALPKPAYPASRPEKAAEAQRRALAALAKGDLEEAASEAVMATAFHEKSEYFFTAARVYLAKRDYKRLALYAAKANKAEESSEPSAQYQQSMLVAEARPVRDELLASISLVCPSPVGRDVGAAFQAIAPSLGEELTEAIIGHEPCFLAVFPELPLPLTVEQNGAGCVAADDGAFIVVPGAASIASSNYPSFSMQLQGEPGKLVEFRPRDALWMKGRLTLKGVPPAAVLAVDGKPASPIGDLLLVQPVVPHRLVVTASGRQRFKSDEFAIPLAGAEVMEVRNHTKRSWVPWLLAGLGLVGTGVGAYFMWDATSSQSDFDQGLRTDSRDYALNVGREQGMAAQDDANAAWGGGLTGVIGGGTLALSGVIWMLLEDTTPPEWRE